MSGKEGHRGWGWIRKRPSGRHQASYIGPDNQRHFAPHTFEQKMHAEEWLAQERRLMEQDRSQWVSPKIRELTIAAMFDQDKTVEQYGKQWIKQRNLKPKTVAHYSGLLDRNITPKLGVIPIRQLNAATVRNWYSTTLTDKPVMRSHAYQLLHAICKTAVSDELLDRNPCMIAGAASAKTSRKAVVPTIAELAIMAEKIEPKFKAYILISAWCGVRFSEMVELRRKDISEGCEVIEIHRNAPHITKNQAAAQGIPFCQVGTTKTNEKRESIVPPHIRDDIQHHLDTYAEPGDEGRLFVPVRGGCHVVEKVVRDAFRSACADAGVNGMRIHDMRHFAGHQTARVANLPETMKRLGHSTSTASLRYQGEVSGRDVEIADALSALAKVPELPDDSTEAEVVKALEKQGLS